MITKITKTRFDNIQSAPRQGRKTALRIAVESLSAGEGLTLKFSDVTSEKSIGIMLSNVKKDTGKRFITKKLPGDEGYAIMRTE